MTEVTVRLLDDPREVAELAGDWLAEHRIEANVPATLLAAALERPTSSPDDTSWAVALDPAHRPVALGVQSPGYPARLALASTDVAAMFARAWHDRARVLPGVAGGSQAAEAFARTWQRLTGLTPRLGMREGLHVLRTFRPATGIPGAARLARVEDLDLVAGWLDAFEGEALPHLPPAVDTGAVRRRIENGGIVLWEDGRPVSLAGWRTATGVGRVGPVYTPPELRRRGYAGAVTSAATRHVLDAGADAVLYTDLANPTSNGVYARLGYELVSESAEWVFT